MHDVLESCFAHKVTCKAATCTGELHPQVGNLVPKSGEIGQGTSVTNNSCLWLVLSAEGKGRD